MLAAQLLFDTLALGCAYALVALGFVLVLNATGAVNFAHGELVMAGGLGAAVLGSALGWSGLMVLPVVMAATALLGLVVAWAAYAPVRRRPPEAAFITTIAAGIVLSQGANLLWGPSPRAAPPLAGEGAWRVAGLVLPVQSLAVIAVAAGLAGAMHVVLTRTQFGRRLRAAAQDPDMAAAVGIPVGRTVAASFAAGAALAGTAGVLLSHSFFVSPAEGGDYMLKAYVAAVLGGWGSLPGAVGGAMVIAGFEVIYPALPALVPGLAPIGGAFTGAWSAAMLDAAVLLVLWRRPTGLFGEAIQVRS